MLNAYFQISILNLPAGWNWNCATRLLWLMHCNSLPTRKVKTTYIIHMLLLNLNTVCNHVEFNIQLFFLNIQITQYYRVHLKHEVQFFTWWRMTAAISSFKPKTFHTRLYERTCNHTNGHAYIDIIVGKLFPQFLPLFIHSFSKSALDQFRFTLSANIQNLWHTLMLSKINCALTTTKFWLKYVVLH